MLFRKSPEKFWNLIASKYAASPISDIAAYEKKFEKIKSYLSPENHVLDIGCGIGGSAFHMAQNYKVNVHGIDLSKNMIKMARESAAQMEFPDEATVTFEIADATVTDFPEHTFDLIYSRDAILHIYDKLSLFKVESGILFFHALLCVCVLFALC